MTCLVIVGDRQVCHKLGRNQEALKYFNAAIELDHKQAAVLKVSLTASGLCSCPALPPSPAQPILLQYFLA